MTLLTCTAVTRRLAAFHDRELPVPDMIAMEAHVKDCPPCARQLRELQEVGDALRLAAAPGPADDWTGLQPGVISRMRAETHESWTARMQRTFDDMHLVWIALAATAATFLCAAIGLGALHFASPERDDSLAAMIAGLAAPSGPDFQGMHLESYFTVPGMSDDGTMAATLARSISEDELVTAVAAAVTRDGRVAGLSMLTNERDRRELDTILEGFMRAKLEPAGDGESTQAVNLVRLLTPHARLSMFALLIRHAPVHTTVRGKMPRTT
jgi:anti-sigma factor RsiW